MLRIDFGCFTRRTVRTERLCVISGCLFMFALARTDVGICLMAANGGGDDAVVYIAFVFFLDYRDSWTPIDDGVDVLDTRIARHFTLAVLMVLLASLASGPLDDLVANVGP